MKKLTPKDILEIVEANSSFIVTAHVNPDGDSIGSSYGFAYFLKGLGKKVQVRMNDDVPGYLSYLVEDSRLDKLEKADVLFVLDVNTPDRVGDIYAELKESAEKVYVIDHHQEPKQEFDGIYQDVGASSTCEMIWRIAREKREAINGYDEKLKKLMAQALLNGIYTDSGFFSYPRTDQELFSFAGELTGLGADPMAISKNVNQTKKKSTLKLLGLALSKTEYLEGDKLAIVALDEKDFSEAGASREDKEGLVNYGLSIESVEISAFLYKTESDHEPRVSLRSKDIAVDGLARSFGGGGHMHAAASKFPGQSFAEAKSNLIKALVELVNG
ncbi:MAG: bifunctional oligoribonuclease/PAP phosphatase NrnA [Candidatus Kapaibacteriales bacterium]